MNSNAFLISTSSPVKIVISVPIGCPWIISTFPKIIEQSIANNWKGLYELKDNNQNNKRYGRNGFNDPEETMRLIIEGAKAGYAERSAAKGTL